jgi:hypothetical protein
MYAALCAAVRRAPLTATHARVRVRTCVLCVRLRARARSRACAICVHAGVHGCAYACVRVCTAAGGDGLARSTRQAHRARCQAAVKQRQVLGLRYVCTCAACVCALGVTPAASSSSVCRRLLAAQHCPQAPTNAHAVRLRAQMAQRHAAARAQAPSDPLGSCQALWLLLFPTLGAGSALLFQAQAPVPPNLNTMARTAATRVGCAEGSAEGRIAPQGTGGPVGPLRWLSAFQTGNPRRSRPDQLDSSPSRVRRPRP